ncbi:glycine zipper 2TM domain-containing protein [Syntrophus aciditrophicus]|uniref:Hypothetical membrane protein n=1 Tax=Syntrophus aciditrophicus (strain SB) TaxID=56780 RepID=Q2LUJ3_SYNAS|nr:glycine zipper domain-containing protein [Syntrophus aciditrophicus]ABC77750.1 hypothetical membrane protein [Syntrophus aciditrophicus SB]OPY17333.1 MAG: putative outer membrane lipoprotein [Syntrophus sp. PtaB.Bin075]
MKKRIILVLVLAAFVFVTSCQTMPNIPEERKGAATGAGMGAAAGAVLGSVLGKDTKSAVIGGLIGALVGGVLGHYYYDQKRTGTETAKRYDYDVSQGTLLRIEDVSTVPQIVKPGGNVELKMTYALLSDSKDAQLNIVETREIRLGNELVGNPEIRTTRGTGTFTSSIPLTLPETAKKGLYIVTYRIKSGTASDEMQASFTVK